MAPKRCRPAETDLKSLKALSHALLERDIQPTKMSPLVVKHPFTDSGIVGLRKKDGGNIPQRQECESSLLDAEQGHRRVVCSPLWRGRYGV